ncbi:MAG: GNAT family N-acetyltransferase [Candidatus Thorarchaeota archaeon]
MYYGELVCLRSLEMTDIDDIMRFQNDWNLRRWAGVPLPKSRRAIQEWLEIASVAHPWLDGNISFAVVDKRTNEFIGVTRFYDIKSPHHRASLGLGIHNPDNRSKGYGTDTTRVMLWIGFNVLGLHSVYLDTMEHNEHAIHVAEKVGFKRVGMFRETEFIDGKYRGLVYFDILRDEFFEMFPPGNRIGEPFE